MAKVFQKASEWGVNVNGRSISLLCIEKLNMNWFCWELLREGGFLCRCVFIQLGEFPGSHFCVCLFSFLFNFQHRKISDSTSQAFQEFIHSNCLIIWGNVKKKKSPIGYKIEYSRNGTLNLQRQKLSVWYFLRIHFCQQNALTETQSESQSWILKNSNFRLKSSWKWSGARKSGIFHCDFFCTGGGVLITKLKFAFWSEFQNFPDFFPFLQNVYLGRKFLDIWIHPSIFWIVAFALSLSHFCAFMNNIQNFYCIGKVLGFPIHLSISCNVAFAFFLSCTFAVLNLIFCTLLRIFWFFEFIVVYYGVLHFHFFLHIFAVLNQFFCTS